MNNKNFKHNDKTRNKPVYRSKTKKKQVNKKNDELIRLNKYIAASGKCSRREADTYIEAGLVRVNGKVVNELGAKVKPGDKVTFNGEVLRNEKLVYVLLNKPKGFVTSTKDPKADRLVIDLVKNCCTERIYPVGRLDKNTTGVLLLTNDGELAAQLTHPKYNKKKIYHVFLNKNLTKTDLNKLVEGFELEDGFISADAASYVNAEDKSQVGVEIHSGKNRIVRRMFEHLGYKVKKLDRVLFAGLTKKGLSRGKWRFLTEKEIGMLKMRSYK